VDNNGNELDKSSVVCDNGPHDGGEVEDGELGGDEIILECSESCIGVKKHCSVEEHCDPQDGQDLICHVDGGESS